MTISREDQSTFILIGIILIICLVALISVLAGVWALIREPVNRVGEEISELIRKNQVYDYNFTIPEVVASANNNEQNANSLPSVDYNFKVPEGFKSFEGVVLTQDQINQIENGEEISIADLQIAISKLGLKSPILQGNNSEELLQQGFWLAPISNTLGKGQILLFCHRTYFGPYNEKSCWFIDTLSQGDEIIIKVNGEELRYKVLSSDVVEADNELIYQLDSEKDLIKIVTFTPRETGEQRLEIIATRVG